MKKFWTPFAPLEIRPPDVSSGRRQPPRGGLFLTGFIQLCWVGFLARLGYQMGRSPVLPRFAQDLSASPELIGLIVAASTLTGVLIKLPAGVLSDIFSRRKIMVLAMCFFAFPPLLYPFVHTPYQLLALRFLHGFATAIFGPVASAYVASLYEKDRGEKLGWFAASCEFGSTVGPLLGGFLLYASSSFTITYLGVAFLSVWPLFFLLRIGSDVGHEGSERMASSGDVRPDHRSGLPPTGVGADRGRLRLPACQLAGRQRSIRSHSSLSSTSVLFFKGLLEIIQHRSILIASAMEACLFLGIGALSGFLPLYAREHGINEAQVGILLGIQLVMAMGAKPLTGRVSDHVGRKPMIVSGLILCALILPCVTWTGSFWPLLVLCFFFGLGMAIVTPSTTALVADLCRNGKYGSAMGVFGTIWDMGEASGPILAGVLIGSFGYAWSFGVIALLMLAGAFLFGVFVPDPRARQ